MVQTATFRLEKAEIDPDHLLLSQDPRWQLAQRVAESDVFARSVFLPKFLLYICELGLLGKTEELKEQQIGVRVFNRPPDYNPGDDNIVRNYAVQLRKRLSSYFEHDGQQEPFVIEIPRGGYVPVFHPRSAGIEVPPSVMPELHPGEEKKEVSQTALPQPQGAKQINWWMFFAGVAATLLIFGGLTALPKVHRTSAAPPHPSNSLLWSSIFSQSRDTLVVPADSGLGILQNLTQQPATLTSYLNGEYLLRVKVNGLDQDDIDDLRIQRYTSMIDLNIVSKLLHLQEATTGRLVIRYARDLRMDDLMNDNVILLGAIHTDPWVALLQKNLNFQFICGKHVNDCYILNSHPTQGELPIYRSTSENGSHETYAIAALLPNLNRTGYILLIEGLNMAGTEASANILLDNPTMNSILHRDGAHGDALKPFELLIKTGSIGAEALPAKIVASRVDE
jgi:hypothetical protein